MVNPQGFYFPLSDNTSKKDMRAELQAHAPPERLLAAGSVEARAPGRGGSQARRRRHEGQGRERRPPPGHSPLGERQSPRTSPSPAMSSPIPSAPSRPAARTRSCCAARTILASVYLQKYFGGGLDGLTGLSGYRREIVKKTTARSPPCGRKTRSPTCSQSTSRRGTADSRSVGERLSFASGASGASVALRLELVHVVVDEPLDVLGACRAGGPTAPCRGSRGNDRARTPTAPFSSTLRKAARSSCSEGLVLSLQSFELRL